MNIEKNGTSVADKTMLTLLMTLIASGASGILWGQEPLTAEALLKWQRDAKKVTVVDVRSGPEFQAEHIPGALNVPHNRILESRLSKRDALVLYCTGEGCPLSQEAAKRLVSSGYKKVFVLKGGIAEWEAQGYPMVSAGPSGPKNVTRAGRIIPRDLHGRLREGGVLVVDVRPPAEFSSGHIPGAVNIPLEGLADRAEELDKSKPVVVYDRLAQRSRRGGELLGGAGYRVEELAGGIAVWIAMKLPVEM